MKKCSHESPTYLYQSHTLLLIHYVCIILAVFLSVGDDMARHSGKMFTTKDKDNDNSVDNCEELAKGAWWYDGCKDSNLNRFHHTGFLERISSHRKPTGISWYRWKGHKHSLKSTTMKIRRA